MQDPQNPNLNQPPVGSPPSNQPTYPPQATPEPTPQPVTPVPPTEPAPMQQPVYAVPPQPMINPAPTGYPPQTPMSPEQMANPETSDKSYIMAVVLSYLFGTLGVDRFYLGYIGTGILKLLTFGGFGIWYFIDIARIIFGNLKDKQHQVLEGYYKNNRTLRMIFYIITGFQVVSFIIGVIIIVSFFRTATSGVNTAARDTEREVDIRYLQGQLEVYYAFTGAYPSLTDLNDASWRSTNMQGLDAEALKDPGGSSSVLANQPTKQQYSYEPYPDGCTTRTAISYTNYCISYTLTATNEDGSHFAKINLN